MKKTLLSLVLPALLMAQSYTQIIENVDNSLKLKSAMQMQKAAQKLYESAQGKNYPTLEASFTAYRLYEEPTITFYLPGMPPQTAPMGKQNNFKGALSLKYPLFTGFAISGYIDEAKFRSQKARLEVADLRRNLYLGATRLAVAVIASQESLTAMEKAKEATQKALKKAEGFYNNGLIPPSDLYNIQAKKYQIESSVTELRSRHRQLLAKLSYLLSTKVDSVSLPAVDTISLEKGPLLQKALTSREDILALEAALNMDRAKKEMARSGFYPKLALAAEFKRQGDTLELDGDGYTNADRSYAGAVLNWNLFNGMSDAKKVEAAKLKEMATQTKLNDYKEKIKQEFENAFLELEALRSKLQSAQMETKAKEEYYQLTLGRFENQLASADELSRSIADLANAKAKSAIFKSRLFEQTQKILLLTNTTEFLEKNGIEAKSSSPK